MPVVLRQPVLLGVARLGLLLVDRVAGRVRTRMLLLRSRGLAMVLLVNNARGPGMLQVWRNRTLLLVMRVVLLHRGDNH